MFIGCPVALGFINTRILMSSPGPGEEEIRELREIAERERPDAKHVRGCALIAIAYSLEELRFRSLDIGRDITKDLDSIPTPISTPEALEPIITLLEQLKEDVTASFVEGKLVGRDLSAGQLNSARVEDLNLALPQALVAATKLRDVWESLDDIGLCGTALGVVCRALRTPYSRKHAYTKGFLERAHVR